MAADTTLTGLVDELIGLFNRNGMDLPDGLFDLQTQFVLNGKPFETLVGRPEADPLVLMLTRGAAGYRFAVKGLQHALPDARIERGEIAEGTDESGARRLATELWLSGHLQGTGEAIESVVAIEVTIRDNGAVALAAATMDEPALDLIRAARLRP